MLRFDCLESIDGSPLFHLELAEARAARGGRLVDRAAQSILEATAGRAAFGRPWRRGEQQEEISLVGCTPRGARQGSWC